MLFTNILDRDFFFKNFDSNLVTSLCVLIDLKQNKTTSSILRLDLVSTYILL